MSTSTPTPTRDPAVVERVQVRALRPYRVIIHDDPVHTYLEVTVAVHRTVPGKSLADGWEIATLVDTRGQGIFLFHSCLVRKFFAQPMCQSLIIEEQQ